MKKRTSFKRWRNALGPTVPLRMVPDLLQCSAPQVRRLIEQKLLPVHRFDGQGGEVIRLVRVEDLERIRRPKAKITMEGLRYAMNRMIEAD